MRPTRTLLGPKARKAIQQGVNAVYLPVRNTFGPEGKSALLFRGMNKGPRMTDDGVTVADCQEPKDQFVRMAAQTFKEGCRRTVEKVGDGTTCTAILGGVLFNKIYKDLEENESEIVGKKNVVEIKREILKSAENIKEQIRLSAKKIETLEDLEKIAIISVKDKELGKLVAKMAWEVGVDGFIDVVEGYKGEIETEVIKGMRFFAKVPAKVFVNNPNRYEMIAEDSQVLITNYAMDNVTEFGPAFRELNKSVSKLVIIAPSFSENVLVNFVNTTKAGFFITPVLAPSLRTEQLEDLAVYCGAKFIDKAKGNKLRNVRAEDLGFLEKIIVKDSESKEDAVITGGGGQRTSTTQMGEVELSTGKSKVEERIEILKEQLAETKQEMFKKLLERRIASMASAVGVIRVGDSTQASSLYQKLKIEDAVYACKAALKGGYVRGGGLCLKEIADNLPETDVLKKVIIAPFEQIQSSVDGGMEISEDVIDPADAIYYAVEHSTQVVAQLITCESITCEEEDTPMNDGLFAIANAIMEKVITDKIEKGQLKAGEAQQYRDSMGGLNEQEFALINDND